MSNVTKAGFTIEFGTKEYELSPLGLRELEYLENFVRGQVIAAGRESIPEDCSAAEREILMRPVMAIAMEVTVMEPGGFEKLKTPAGVVRMLYASLKAKNPEVTLEDCRKMMSNSDVARQVRDAIEQLNPNPRQGQLKNPQAPPTGGESQSANQTSSSSSAIDSTSSPAK